MKSLLDIFSEIPDRRRDQGIRYPMPTFLNMIVLGYIGGSYSGKSLARYFKNNESDLVDLFGLLHGVPGSTKINTFLKSLDFEILCEKFYEWLSQYNDDNKWVSIDGKSLRHTITNSKNSKQNFMTMVGAFAQQSGITLKYKSHENGKGSEPAKARELIESMKGEGYIFTLDAIHCQKKRSKPSWSQEMTI